MSVLGDSNRRRDRSTVMAAEAPTLTAPPVTPPTAGAQPASAIPGRGGGGGGGDLGGGREGGISLGTLRNLRTFVSLKSPSFRLFYAAMLCQMAAMNMEMVARGLLVYLMTGSGTILGVMALANSLPMLFFSLWGGVAADRVHKKYLMIAGQGMNSVFAAFIAIAITMGLISEGNASGVWILIAASLFKGTVQGFMMPARQSIIPELVPRDQIMNALALNNLGMNLLRLLAPLLAGFAVYWWGFEAVYYIMTALFVAATLLSMPLPKTPYSDVVRTRVRPIAEMVDGFRYVVREKTIALVLFFTLFVVLCSMPYMMLLPIFTEEVLGVGSKGMGILVSVSGIGAIVGSLVLASLPNRHRGVMLIVSSMVLGIALTAFAFSTHWELSLAVIVFVGLGQAGRMTLSGTLLQSYTTDEYRGRVMSIYMMEFGLTSLSVFAAGVLSDYIGIAWSIGGLAMMLVALSAAVLVFSPRLRNLQ